MLSSAISAEIHKYEERAMAELGIVVRTKDNYILIWNTSCTLAAADMRNEGLVKSAILIEGAKVEEH